MQFGLGSYRSSSPQNPSLSSTTLVSINFPKQTTSATTVGILLRLTAAEHGNFGKGSKVMGREVRGGSDGSSREKEKDAVERNQSSNDRRNRVRKSEDVGWNAGCSSKLEDEEVFV
ncbi:hypothetical protein L6452_09289 [Arctium lappa]|uniref:Uncharacterized protein n=1 Tax=Arctium lappa TaxID=4217 RepID=A0ACB9DKM1_ARCLA|nr:hypothetical protein L6452_09289 [Arctium lappa]